MAKDKVKDDERDTEEEQPTLYDQLSKPFPPDCVEWLILNAKDVKQQNDFWVYAIASPYIQKESAEDRADQVFGPNNWENDFTFPNSNGRFVYRIQYEWNGKLTTKKAGGSVATDSKGGFNDSDFEIALSYAEKRCWQKIGIGRYLKLVKPKKVTTKLDFEAGWERYSFESKWQKSGKGKPKYIKFWWKQPSLPNKALPEEYQDQNFDDTGSPDRKPTKVATEEQWEQMEAYLEYAPSPEDEQIREVIYNEIVDEKGEDHTGEVTYERKKFTFEFAEKVIDRLSDKYGPLVDGVPGNMDIEEVRKKEEEPEPEFEDEDEDEPKPKNPEKDQGQQGDLLPDDGKQQAKKTYEAPAKDEPEK